MNNVNEINAEINTKKDDINKDIRIINSYERYKRELEIKDKDEYKNEKEIIDNCEIKINNKKIPFSYFYKFLKKENIILNIHLKII